MEHYPNSQPMDHRRWVGFDAFDKIMDEALSDLDQAPGSEAAETDILVPDPPEAV